MMLLYLVLSKGGVAIVHFKHARALKANLCMAFEPYGLAHCTAIGA